VSSCIEIFQVLLQLLKGLSLSPIVRELLKISEPHVLVLPVDILHLSHIPSIPLVTGLRNLFFLTQPLMGSKPQTPIKRFTRPRWESLKAVLSLTYLIITAMIL